MIYEHLTKAGDQKGSILSGTIASSPFSSLAKNTSSGQAQHHSLQVENLLNYGTKKSSMTTANNSVPKIDEVKPEVKYSNLALNGNASSMSSIISESFIKKTLMDEEVKKEQQPKRNAFSQLKEELNYKSLIEGHVDTLKHRMTGTV